jgi:hypothetical protein
VEQQGAEMKTQRGTIEQLQSTVAKLQLALEKQAAQLQKVSLQLVATQPADRLVTNE